MTTRRISSDAGSAGVAIELTDVSLLRDGVRNDGSRTIICRVLKSNHDYGFSANLLIYIYIYIYISSRTRKRSQLSDFDVYFVRFLRSSYILLDFEGI